MVYELYLNKAVKKEIKAFLLPSKDFKEAFFTLERRLYLCTAKD